MKGANTTYALGAAFVLLLPGSVSAKSHAPGPVSKAQTQAFALGYVLRTSDVCSEVFIHAVVNLKNMDDDQQTKDEIDRLSGEVRKLREAQSLSYGQIENLITGQDTTANALRVWAIQSSLRLSDNLIYSSEEKKLARTDTSGATILAELDELQALKAAANAHQPQLTLWMKGKGRAQSLWAAELGAYAANLDASTTDVTLAPLPSTAETERLLNTAPVRTPPSVLEGLASLLPHGGNLQSLATVPPKIVPGFKISHVYQLLLTAYDARKLAAVLEKGV